MTTYDEELTPNLQQDSGDFYESESEGVESVHLFLNLDTSEKFNNLESSATANDYASLQRENNCTSITRFSSKIHNSMCNMEAFSRRRKSV